MINKFIRAIAAGLMIGIAGAIYLAVGPPLGAILFAIGLIIICNRKYNLYTGKIGYIQKPWEIIDMLIYIGGNAVGTLMIAATQTMGAQDLVAAKLTLPWYLVLAKAIGCGFLMYIAVDVNKRDMRYPYLGIITCIPAFILAGFEHSIADMYYFFCARSFTWQSLLFIVIVIIGNAIGANLHHLDKLKKL